MSLPPKKNPGLYCFTQESQQQPSQTGSSTLKHAIINCSIIPWILPNCPLGGNYLHFKNHWSWQLVFSSLRDPSHCVLDSSKCKGIWEAKSKYYLSKHFSERGLTETSGCCLYNSGQFRIICLGRDSVKLYILGWKVSLVWDASSINKYTVIKVVQLLPFILALHVGCFGRKSHSWITFSGYRITGWIWLFSQVSGHSCNFSQYFFSSCVIWFQKGGLG